MLSGRSRNLYRPVSESRSVRHWPTKSLYYWNCISPESSTPALPVLGPRPGTTRFFNSFHLSKDEAKSTAGLLHSKQKWLFSLISSKRQTATGCHF